MKGTMSEMELSVFRQRSIEAMKQKAGRGELFLTVAVGYVKGGRDNIEKDPDRRVQEAVALVFRKFTELQTIRQVLVWLRQEKIPLPVLTVGEAADRVIWRAPVYPTVHHILTNPVYAGAYAFGRRTMRVVIENGRKRIIRSMQRDWRSWSVLIQDHHEDYIPWVEFERNQHLIADNANGKRFMSRGAIRRGEALLAGLLRCARCGRKLHVRYSDGAPRYQCVDAFNHLAAARCIIFSGARLDRMVSKEVLDRLQPIGVEAALAGIDARSQKGSEKRDQLEFALRQARYEAARARRQYDAIDPDNRLVAGELERRWNQRLVAVRNLEVEVDQLDAGTEQAFTSVDRERLMALGRDLTIAWDSPGATPETRKKIIRTVISEIIVDVVGDTLELVIHWQGGDHTALTVKKNRNGRTDWCTDDDIVDLVRALARHMPDQTIAAVLNRLGKSTSHGHSWIRGSVCSLRHQNDVAIHRPGERAERGEATINEAAVALDISTTTVRRLIASGALPATQPCKGAPWIIRQADLACASVRNEASARRSRRPSPDDRQQNILHL
jgi:excisionase family DNA binding protein